MVCIPVWRRATPPGAERNAVVRVVEHQIPGSGSHALLDVVILGEMSCLEHRPNQVQDSFRWMMNRNFVTEISAEKNPQRSFAKWYLRINNNSCSDYNFIMSYEWIKIKNSIYLSKIFSASGMMELIPISNAEKKQLAQLLFKLKMMRTLDLISLTQIPITFPTDH